MSSSGRQGNNSSGGLLGSGVAISADGRYVAFESFASNLVPNDTDCCGAQVYVHDRRTGRTEQVSVGRTRGKSLWRSGGR